LIKKGGFFLVHSSGVWESQQYDTNKGLVLLQPWQNIEGKVVYAEEAKQEEWACFITAHAY
jgi:hypothetical protein